MSANADYDVSIVESFAPPANWIPNQTVNKDVYAVNTGSIAAFVEETVSSLMTVTKEQRVPAAQKETKLTEAERYSIEAGSYLALVKPDGATASTHQPGEKIVSFTVNDATDLDGYSANTVVTDFTPDVSGVYVFRRSIDVDNGDQSETFKYESYYYDADTDTYYKTALTSVTPDTVADFAGDNVRTDGNLSDAEVVYFKDVTTTTVPKLTYDAANHRLVATVEGTSYIDDDALKAYAEAYDDAIHDYQTALAERARALAEDENATDELKTKHDTLVEKEIDEAAKEKAFKEALAAYNALKAQLDAATTELGDETSGVTKARNDILEELYGNTTNTPSSLPTASDPPTQAQVNAMDNGFYKTMMQALIDKNAAPADEAGFLADLQAWIVGAGITPANGSYTGSETLDELVEKLSYAQLQTFKTWIDANTTSENHNKYLKEAEYLIAKKAYDDKVAEYNTVNALYNNLTSRVGNASSGLTQDVANALSTLVGSNAVDLTADLDAIVDALDESSTQITNSGLYGDWYNAAIATAVAQDEYDDAYDAVYTGTTSSSANLNAANAAVAQAKAKMDAASALYQQAVTEYNANQDIVVYINLLNDVTEGGTADKWQILPTTVANDTAYFYYTGILEGGETSAQLIDNVQLAPTVTQDMYKYFDFDLNVALKSAQITYADDNTTILATAANDTLDADATLTNPTNIGTALTWN